MRLNRLDLTRYGVFTDDSIDFGERKAGTPDLHIIYGENEAGKSTALAAFLDLLFGMELRSRYGFLHPYSTMRIGGELEINGAARTFARVKRPQNSLLDGNDSPIADGAILSDLGGIDRASYKTMFSLDDETLEQGGESILASKGDLGQLLFSASAGLSDLADKLLELSGKAENFYKYRARGGELSRLKGELIKLKDERARIDTAASEYARLVEARDRASSQYDEAIAERGRIQARREELQRHLGALPRLVELRRVRALLEPLASLTDAPPDWAADLPAMQKEEITLATQAKSVEAEIKAASDERDAIMIDKRVSELADKIELLGDLRARHVTAEKDIPKLRVQLKDATLEIAHILKRLERDPAADPAGILLGVSTVGALRGLMERRSGIDAAKVAADKELAEARRRLAVAESNLKTTNAETPGGTERASAIARLESTLTLARASDHNARSRFAQRSRQDHLEKVAQHLQTLRPWTGEVKALADLLAPDGHDRERWKDSIATFAKRVEKFDAEIENLIAERGRHAAEIDAIGKVDGVVTDQDAAKTRAAREEAWAEHKRALDAGSAVAFEETLRRDDLVTNGRIGNAAEVANLNQIAKALAIAEAGLDAARANRKDAAEKLAEVEAELAAAIRSMDSSLPEDWSVPQLEAWLDRRNKALEAYAAVAKADKDIADAETDKGETRRKLTEALGAVGKSFEKDSQFDDLIAIAEAAIAGAAELKALQSEVMDRRREVEARKQETNKANCDVEAWDNEWAEICTASWLGEAGSIPPVATLREVLAALDTLEPLAMNSASLSDRIAKMENDQRQFAEEIAGFARALDLDPSLSTLELDTRLTKAVDDNKTAEAARDRASDRLKDAEGRKLGIEDQLEIHNQRKAKMIGHFKVASLDEVGSKLGDLEKRKDLQRQEKAAEDDILAAVAVTTVTAAIGVLEKIDRGAVESEIAELDGRFEDQDNRSRELFTERSKASDGLEAVGGDEAVAKIEEQRKTIFLEIEEGAERYLRLRLGIAAAEQALRLYRDQHRSSMMTRASEAFQTVSRGAYKGLSTQPEKDNEVLIAVSAGGGSKTALEMSKGTRFQLYLALRVAGYLEFAEGRPSVPFIADDIMETFDDFRAEEAFKLFAEMSKVGQVIYLTHHRHLCDIARLACPTAKIHELSKMQGRW